MLMLVETIPGLPRNQRLCSSLALTGTLIATPSISTLLVATLTTSTVVLGMAQISALGGHPYSTQLRLGPNFLDLDH